VHELESEPPLKSIVKLRHATLNCLGENQTSGVALNQLDDDLRTNSRLFRIALAQELQTKHPKHPMAEAVSNVLGQWEGLKRVLLRWRQFV
jgi:hypothetical protein